MPCRCSPSLRGYPVTLRGGGAKGFDPLVLVIDQLETAAFVESVRRDTCMPGSDECIDRSEGLQAAHPFEHQRLCEPKLAKIGRAADRLEHANVIKGIVPDDGACCKDSFWG